MIDRAEWEEHLKANSQARVKRSQDTLKQVAMGVPPMEALTGDPNWDIFTKIAQARIDELKEELTARRSRLTDGPYEGTDEIIAQRIEISRVVGQVESLTNIQMIPKRLKEKGAEAAKLLREAGIDLP